MAHLVEDITKFFVFEDIDIDNYHFKLYSKGCVIFFFAGSMVGVMSQVRKKRLQVENRAQKIRMISHFSFPKERFSNLNFKFEKSF